MAIAWTLPCISQHCEESLGTRASKSLLRSRWHSVPRKNQGVFSSNLIMNIFIITKLYFQCFDHVNLLGKHQVILNHRMNATQNVDSGVGIRFLKQKLASWSEWALWSWQTPFINSPRSIFKVTFFSVALSERTSLRIKMVDTFSDLNEASFCLGWKSNILNLLKVGKNR